MKKNHPNRNWRRRLHDLADQISADTPAREAYRLGYHAGYSAGRAAGPRPYRNSEGVWCRHCERVVPPRLDLGNRLCPYCGFGL